MSEQALSFGSFQLFPTQRLLLDAGKPLRLGSRAFDILIALAARPGEVINKEELIARVWPDTFVEEASLRVHIVALRKALGDDHTASRFIANVPGRGYCFVASITSQATSAPAAVQQSSDRPLPAHLPISVTRIIGRDETIAAIATQLESSRLVTIVGPGGIGKTTVALAVAEAVADSYRDGVAFVDLASVNEEAGVPGALAAALGLTDRSETLMPALITFLRGRQMLIVLDNCEHLIAAATDLAEFLLRQVPETRLLVTSREQLRAAGEWLQRLGPLETPPASDDLSAAEAQAYPAVQLFVERAAACLGGYELRDGDAPFVAEICRRLDGIALAIELATGQLDMMGVRDLAASLDDCFQILTRGRRTALPRHQTLRATLDWSYRLLPPFEQLVLQRLAVFNGGFTLEAARTVAAGKGLAASEIVAGVTNLIAKSLISADIGGDAVRYRLLDTTRAYGLDQLDAAGAVEQYRRQHALYYRTLFERAEAEWETRPTPEWLDDYARHIGNLRAALDWAFSPGGDAKTGIALTVAAVPFWLALLLVDECQGRVQRALASMDGAPDGIGDRDRMRLHAALGWPQMRAIGGLKSGHDAWAITLENAEKLGDVDYQMRALWALWVDRTNHAEPHAALAMAQKFCDLATDPADRQIGERMIARSLCFIGDFAGAHRHITQMLDAYEAPINRSHTVRFQYDQRITARLTLARLLWLRGFPDQALREVESCVQDALALGHNLTLAHTLSDAACEIALLCGDLAAADRYVAQLKDQTRTQSLDVWNTYGDCYLGDLAIRRGDIDGGLNLLRVAIQKLNRANFILYQTEFLGIFAQGEALAGNLREALATVDVALAQCAKTGEGWLLPELHRIQAEILVQKGRAGGEDILLQGLKLAGEQGGLSWELRCATSLARLWATQGKRDAARDLLAGVYGRMTEGFGTADLVTARTLLEDLA